MKFSLPDSLSDVAATLRRTLGELPVGRGNLESHLPEMLREFLDRKTPDTSPRDTRFLAKSFTSPAGTRPYKLYVPSGYRGTPVPLIIMLHGCMQSSDDFAIGTQMNAAAEAHTCLVAWPEQTNAANMQKCWNWFKPSDQQRDRGEPAVIAGITRQVMRDYAVDARRVYVAGLSAGGAAAAIMGEAYPDLYAAIGVHSGLACGAARDMPSAFAVMQAGGDGHIRPGKSRIVPTIVFHGDRDTTVNARNGDAVVAQVSDGADLISRVETGRTADGRRFSRTLFKDSSGAVMIEQWRVQGAGHAWFGGHSAGSFTDPKGPDATREMMRFFLAHPR